MLDNLLILGQPSQTWTTPWTNWRQFNFQFTIMLYSVHLVLFSPLQSIQSTLALFCPLRSYLVLSIHFDPIWSNLSISILFSPYQSYSVHSFLFGPFVLIGSIHSYSFLFGPPCSYSPIRSYFVHLAHFVPFGSIRSILITLVHWRDLNRRSQVSSMPRKKINEENKKRQSLLKSVW